MSTAFPLLLRSDHRILRNESCSGYVDIFGIWNTGFYCPQSESKSAVYCCGTDTYKYCCTTKSTNPDETSSEVPSTTVFIRTPVIIGVVTGFIIMAAFVILTVCFICPCCFFYKKRTTHIPTGLYRIQCGTSSTTSALVNLHSPLSSGNTPLENNNMWSQHPPRIFTTMTPPYNNCRGVPTDTLLPSSSSNSNSNGYFHPNIPQINNNNHVPPVNNFLRSFSSRTNNTNWNSESYCDNMSMNPATSRPYPNYHQLLGSSNNNQRTAPYYANLLHSRHPTFQDNSGSTTTTENNIPCASTIQTGTSSTNENQPWGSLTFPANQTNILPRRSDLTTANCSSAAVSRSVNNLGDSVGANQTGAHIKNANSTPATSGVQCSVGMSSQNPTLLMSFVKSTTSNPKRNSSDSNQFNSLSRIAALLQMNDTPPFPRSSCSQNDVVCTSSNASKL